VIVPDGMVVELLEATRAGSIDTYEKLARYMDEQISVAVLGETMTTGAQAGGVGGSQAGVHNEVRKEIAQADADLLSETLNNTLVKFMAEGGKVYACRFALQALYGQTEAALLPGIRPVNPLDVLDIVLLHRKAGAFILNTWTL